MNNGYNIEKKNRFFSTGCDIMVTKESVTIDVPVGMSKYLITMNPDAELTRNALLLYPYILNQTISHGRAAEIWGIRKSELINLYDKLGYSYFDMTMDDLDDELNTFRELKKKYAAIKKKKQIQHRKYHFFTSLTLPIFFPV